MPLYEGSALTTIVTASVDAVIAAFHAGTRPSYVREIHLFALTAPTTSAALLLKRSTAIGTGALTGNAPLPRDPNGLAATATIVTAWGTAAPSVTANPAGALRRFAGAAAVGTGIIWTFYEGNGLMVPATSAVNSELCICNGVATAPGTWEITVVYEE